MPRDDDKSGPTLAEISVLVLGYAISFGLPRLSLLEAARIALVNGPSWWRRGWPIWVDLLLLGPTLAGPLIYAIRARRGSLGPPFSGVALWCLLGLLKWAHVVSWYFLYDRPASRYLLVWICHGFGLIACAGSIVVLARRGAGFLGRANVFGLALGLGWTVYSAANYLLLKYEHLFQTL